MAGPIHGQHGRSFGSVLDGANRAWSDHDALEEVERSPKGLCDGGLYGIGM